LAGMRRKSWLVTGLERVCAPIQPTKHTVSSAKYAVLQHAGGGLPLHTDPLTPPAATLSLNGEGAVSPFIFHDGEGNYNTLSIKGEGGVKRRVRGVETEYDWLLKM